MRLIRAGLFFAIALLLGILLSCRADAADLYASPAGTTTAAGTQADPLDLPTAVGPASPARPGDTLWLETGVYHYPFTANTGSNGELGDGFQITLAGTAAAPITIRGMETPNSHVTIDGGLCLVPPATHLIIRDMEITTLQPRPAGALSSNTVNLPIPWGGLNVFSGDGDQFVDLVIHDNCQGISLWSAATNSEVEGCIVYHDGWQTSPDGSGNGHEIYVQNIAASGTKTFDDDVVEKGYSGYSFHAYGEGGHVENIHVIDSTFVGAANVLIGGNLPSSGIVVDGCNFEKATLACGWYAPYNEDVSITNCTGDDMGIDVKNYVHAIVSNNVIIASGVNIVQTADYAPPAGETTTLTYTDNINPVAVDFFGHPAGWQPPTLYPGQVSQEVYPGYVQVSGHGSTPTTPTIRIVPDKYNPDRASVTVFDWPGSAVSLDLSSVLKPGDKFRLMNAFDVYGTPILTGAYTGPISVNPGRFATYVLVRDAPPAVTLDSLAAEMADLMARVAALEKVMPGNATPAGAVGK